MPTYEYKCDTCGKFEHWQNITEDALETCPTCGGQVKRLISRNVNIIFKGPGFYVTDNRSSASGGDSAKNSASESSGGSSDAGGSGSANGKSEGSGGSTKSETKSSSSSD